MWPSAETIQQLIEHGVVPKLNGVKLEIRRRLRWATAEADKPKVDQLRAIASEGERLEELTKQPGWEVVLRAKAYWQATDARMALDPAQSETVRLRSACNWAALEGFFRDIEVRIRRGRDAREQLKGLLTE